nr:hypothetical protein [Tanacetum cinerariifolium]
MKSWLVQKQTALGKDTSNPLIADSLLKTIWFSIHHFLSIEVLAIPGQTATGKESSNPFMAGSLPKTILYSFLHKICFHGGCDELGLSAARLLKFLLSGKSVVKRTGDITRLQALVDKKNIVISEDAIREILQLDDAEGVVCLPNDEIFMGLAQMGYEKPSTKLTFYKAFFSSQWKFLIHTIIQSLNAKRTSWNEFSTAMASAVICLSKGQRFNFLRYIFDSLVRNVDSSSKFYMYPHFIQLIIQTQVVDLSNHTTRYISPALTQKVFANIRRVRKGCSGVETPLFENMLQDREEDAKEEVQVSAHDDVDQENVIEEIADDVAHPTSPLPPSPIIQSSPPHQSPRASPSQAAEGPSILVQQVLDKCSALVHRVEGLERLKKVGTFQRIVSSEDEENVLNQGRKSVDIDERIELVDDQEKDVQVKGRQADTQAKIYNIDLDHASKALSMQEDLKVQEVVEVVNAAKLITEVVTAATTRVIPTVEHVVAAVSTPISAAKPKVLKVVPGASTVFTRKRKGVVIRDPEEELHDDTLAETQSGKDKGKAQKAAKIKRLREQAKEAKDLKKQFEVVADEDDDVFVEATPIGTKVPVVNYEIVMINNKPREDLEDLWKIVKAIFSTSKPNNFTNDYVLATLKNMFEKTDAQDVIWRSQQTEHG